MDWKCSLVLNVFVVVGLCTTESVFKNVTKRQTNYCRSADFRCGGRCISKYEVCDGTKDCSDGSDETSIACKLVNITTCPEESFQCHYGACIRGNLKCDGINDCSDASDEIGCPDSNDGPQSLLCAYCNGVVDCSDWSDETELECNSLTPGIMCGAGQWRCNYGTCLRLAVRCNGRKDCWDNSDEVDCPTATPPAQPTALQLPPSSPPTPPKNTSRGKMCVIPNPANNRLFESFNCLTGNGSCSLVPGQTVPNQDLAVVSCDLQHQLDHFGPYITACKDGVWFPEMPQCSKFCPTLESTTLDLTCYQGPAVVNCNGPMLTETIVKFKCREQYEMNNNQLSFIRCTASGHWSGQLPQCSAKCGQSSLSTTFTTAPIIVSGTPSRVGYFPWFAGIYLRQTNGWEAACGGTLITRKAVLTAAHCVTRASRVETIALPNRDVMVTLGKHYRDWDIEELMDIRSTVDRIVVHPSSRGSPQQYRDDIAVLFLSTEVEVTSFVMPVCVDYNLLHTSHLGQISNIFGYIARWGNTDNCDTFGTLCDSQSKGQLYTRSNIMSYNECYKITHNIYPSSVSSLASDKYCSGNGTVPVVQQGDSGVGHTFVINNAHYIYGIVSTKLKLEVPNKPMYSFATLTNVSYHMEWLRNQLF